MCIRALDPADEGNNYIAQSLMEDTGSWLSTPEESSTKVQLRSVRGTPGEDSYREDCAEEDESITFTIGGSTAVKRKRCAGRANVKCMRKNPTMPHG